MRGPRTHRFALFSAAALAVAVVSACSSGAASTTDSSQGPELTNVNLYTLDSPDTAPVWLAQQKGYFKQEGLNVKIVYVAGSSAVVPALAAHTADFVQMNYVTAFEDEHLHPSLDIKYIADDEQAAPDTNMIMVPKNSKITSVADLKGKTIAFPSTGLALAGLALDEQLRGYGIKAGDFTIEQMAFANAISPLARRDRRCVRDPAVHHDRGILDWREAASRPDDRPDGELPGTRMGYRFILPEEVPEDRGRVPAGGREGPAACRE
jgi:NitT/TauT family transport system substrate-binding protein